MIRFRSQFSKLEPKEGGGTKTNHQLSGGRIVKVGGIKLQTNKDHRSLSIMLSGRGQEATCRVKRGGLRRWGERRSPLSAVTVRALVSPMHPPSGTHRVTRVANVVTITVIAETKFLDR